MMLLVLRKTELGQAEMRNKSQTLNMRERRALILMDGSRDLTAVQAMLGASVEGIAQRLIDLGLVNASGRNSASNARSGGSVEFADAVVSKTPATNFESFNHFLPTHSTVWKSGGYSVDAEIAGFKAATNPSQPAPVQPADKSADSSAVSPRGILLGKMYLADIAERILGKEDTYLRSKIQQIRSVEALFQMNALVMQNIEGLTSPEMLQSIQQRFAEAIAKK